MKRILLAMVLLATPVFAQNDVDEQLRYARSLSAAFQSAAERIEPSVVHITARTERIVRGRDFFGRRMQPRRQYTSGLGSGVVVSDDGYVLTNAHVVENATELMVRLHEGEEHSARIIGTDPTRDIAVLKIDRTGLVPAAFDDSDDLDVGEWVLAVGSPFGFSNTVTAGIVSARGGDSANVPDELREFEDYIQTDAAINPGNSGGPLINLEGEVVGINTAIFSRTGGSIGLGFAIPADVARVSTEEIIRTRARGWLGVEIDQIDDDVIIATTAPDGPADQFGVVAGDIVRRFNGQRVETNRQFVELIQSAKPGSEAELVLVRNGKTIELDVELGDLSLYIARMFGGAGFRAQTVDEQIAAELGYTDELEGVVVTDVRSGSTADFSGLRPGDVIFGVGDLPVTTATELDAVLRGLDLETGVRLRVLRGGRRGYLDLSEF